MMSAPRDSADATGVPERPTRRAAWLWATCAVLWLTTAASGLWVLWAYENRPGVGAAALAYWPLESQLTRATDRPTLVVLAHPRCPCTRATLAELGEILARAHTLPKTIVLFVKPGGFANGWEMTDLWRTASGLPNVMVIRDDGGSTAARFGAATSGQTFLYDANGALLFSGGITGARAHAGDNAGRTAVLALLNRGTADKNGRTKVFGCPLFGPASRRGDRADTGVGPYGVGGADRRSEQ